MCIDYRSTGELQLKALIIKKGQKKKKKLKKNFFHTLSTGKTARRNYIQMQSMCPDPCEKDFQMYVFEFQRF